MAKHGMIIVNSVNRINNVDKRRVMMQKKPFLIGRTFVAFIIISSMIISQSWTQEKEKEKEENYYKGKRDGEIAGEIESAMACGCISGGCLGPFGGLLFPMVRTKPYDNMMKDIEHKSEDYKSGFRDGFKEKKKSQFKKGVGIGTIIPVVVTAFYLVVIIPQLKNFPYR